MSTSHSEPTTHDFLAEAEATPLNVRETLEHIDAHLAHAGQSEDFRSNMQLVLGEVLNNIAEHAYPEGEDGKFWVRFRDAGDELAVCVCDHGRPMPDEQLPNASAPDFGDGLMDLPEGGYGWFIIGELTNELSYKRDGNDNLLQFRMNRSST